MELDGSSSAEVVVNIGNMMAGFLNHFSKALHTAANYPASEITTRHHHLEPKQVVDQEQKSLMPHVGDNYNMKTGTLVLKRFESLNPPTFDGLAGPKAAEDWMNRIKEILEVILAPKNLCVNFARRMLTGSALAWWKQNKIDNLKNLSQFTRRFLKVYSPVAFKRVCERKVWSLQRDMSVEEYRKMYESDEVNYMSDETDRMHFFYMGLKPLYRRIVGETMLNSYKELVEFTFILERILNHIKEGKVVNLGDYMTKNKKIRYYLEWSEKLISAGCFFCGSVEHYRSECPCRDNQGRIRGGKKVVGKIKKKLKVKHLEFCFYCKRTAHYLRECPLREMRQSRKKAVKKNHKDSFQNNDENRSFPESAGDKGGESRLGCFGCGSREHKRNKCPLSKSRGQKRYAENLSDSLQHINKKFKSVPESSEDKGGKSRLGCFICGSREHRRNECPVIRNQGGKPRVKNLRESFQNKNNSNKSKSVPGSSADKGGGSADSLQNKCSSVTDTAGGSKARCFGCWSKEHIRKDCPVLESKRHPADKGGGYADSLQNKCSSVMESSGDTAGGSKARCCFGCRSKEHIRKDCPVLESKRQSRRENNLNRKRANESVVTDVRSRKAKI